MVIMWIFVKSSPNDLDFSTQISEVKPIDRAYQVKFHAISTLSLFQLNEKKKTSKFMIYSIQQTVFLNITIFKLNQVISNQIHIQNRESISVNQFHNRRSDIMMLY